VLVIESKTGTSHKQWAATAAPLPAGQPPAAHPAW